MKTIPFTYLLTHKPTGKMYYGVRYKKGCSPDDLWKKYFSSSKKVKKLIEEYGIDSFEYSIRKIFLSSLDARNWETKVLTRLKVCQNDKWLNENYGNHYPSTLGKQMPEERKRKIGEAQKGVLNHMWGKTHTEDARLKISIASRGRKHSEESKHKMSIAKKGVPISPDKKRIRSREEIERAAKTNRERAHKRTTEQRERMKKSAAGRRWKKCLETGKRIFYRETI